MSMIIQIRGLDGIIRAVALAPGEALELGNAESIVGVQFDGDKVVPLISQSGATLTVLDGQGNAFTLLRPDAADATASFAQDLANAGLNQRLIDQVGDTDADRLTRIARIQEFLNTEEITPLEFRPPVEGDRIGRELSGVRVNVQGDQANGTPPFNDPPKVVDSVFSIAEDAVAGSVVGAILATDPEGQAVSYALSGEGTEHFTISANGVISLRDTARLNHEILDGFALTVTVTDAAGASTTRSVAIQVTDVNEPPELTNAEFRITTNSAVDTVVGTVSARDPDSGQSLLYSLSGPGSERFAISSTGVITLVNADTLDSAVASTYNLTVTVSDQQNPALRSSAMIAVRVDPGSAEADPPQPTPAPAPNLPEPTPVTAPGPGPGFPPAAPQAPLTLPDASPQYAENDTTVVPNGSATGGVAASLSYSLSGATTPANGDAALFSIDSGTGELRFLAPPDFEAPLDAGSDNGYQLQVDVTDGMQTVTQDIAITVTDVNETPKFIPPAAALFPASLELSSLDGHNGFVLQGIATSDYSGFSVAGAGDINGDGLDDLLIGAYGAYANYYSGSPGETYVVFGSSTGFSAALELSSLNGSNGFVLQGIHGSDYSGRSVSSAGDINGDGLDDLLIGAPHANPNGNYSAGQTYVVFGSRTAFSTSLELSSLNGSNGFVLQGIDAYDYSGISVASGGDINGDGLDDLLIGAYGAGPGGNRLSGETYVVFGSSSGFSASLELDSLHGSNGFMLSGIDTEDFSGRSVSSAGDINGDGLDDLLIGAYGAGRYNAGATYVVYGSSSGFSAALDLGNLDGRNGFVLQGIDDYDYSGRSVSSAGDINGDGLDDLLVGAPFADSNGTNLAGETYVVFGSSSAFSAALELSNLDGRNGFVLNGIDAADFSGRSVSSAGDVNADGLDDLLIGAPFAEPSGNHGAGQSYVVFGSIDGFSASIELSSLNGSNGFVLQGIDGHDYSGWAVSNAGDINGDGIDDLLIGGYGADPNGNSRAGETYVVFGQGQPLRIADNSPAGTVVGSAPLAQDPDINDTLSYSITGGNTGNAFAIDAATGQITVNAAGALDFATTPRFSLTITATDSGGLSAMSPQLILLDDVLGLPAFNRSVGENSTDVVIDLASSGNFTGSPSYTLSTGPTLENADARLFRIDGSTGELRFLAAPDFEAPGDRDKDNVYAVEVDVFDGAQTLTYHIAVSVSDVNEAPKFVPPSAALFPASLELSNLDGRNGFVLQGIDAGDRSGHSVSSAGDINGDGLDDLLIGATDADPNGNYESGETYVVFGSSSGFSAALELSSLNGHNGFVLQGIDRYDYSGRSVSSAGDINGDGLDDLLIGARDATPNGNFSAGETYVVFGSSVGFSAALELSSLDGHNGFVLQGIDRYDNSGRSVSSAGDINGDGLDDLLIGAPSADPSDQARAGESYVVFGSSTGFSAALELSSLNGSNGFVLQGIDPDDYSGFSIASAGDINGDGIDDLLIGAFFANPSDQSYAGETYVVFGSSTGFSAALELSSLNGSNGFVLQGIDTYDQSGYSVSSAGDINGDGLDDLLIGTPAATPNSTFFAGETYVVFGSSTGFSAALELSSLDGHNGFVLQGIDSGDNSGRSVSSAGDINGDGLDDLLIGADRADSNGNYESGETYVLFGSSSGFSAALELSSLDGHNGFVLQGIDRYDYSGRSVSSAGDINGDGLDDLLIGADRADPNGTDEAGETYVVFGRDHGLSIAENSAAGSVVGSAPLAIDPDASDSLSYSITAGNTGNAFAIDPGTGQITVNDATALDFETTPRFDLSITATDSGGLSTTTTQIVRLDNVGEAPTIISTATYAFAENATTVVLDVDASSGEGGPLHYALGTAATPANADASLFSIDSSTGEVRFLAPPDYETPGDADGDNVYQLQVDVSDGGSTTTQGITVTVTDAQEAPKFIPPSAALYPASFELNSSGFVLNGINADDFSGSSVSSAGDINGDGLDDLLIGAPDAYVNGNLRAGETYVVFGSSTGFSAALELSSLNGSNGFVLRGSDAYDFSGLSVSSAGDINGDGLDDLLIGAFAADSNGNYDAGETYVVFGSSNGFSAALALSSLNGSNGFVLEGIDGGDFSGHSVASAGDINGDGLDDLLIGATSADPNGNPFAGETYVVLGSSSGLTSALALSSLNGSNGFVLQGIDVNDYSGRSVSSAGDINGDGIDDLLIGAWRADPNGSSAAGETYVVFGSSTGFSAALELSSLNGSNGFVLQGSDAYDYSGRSVASAGDINGDGLDDLLIGAFRADPNDQTDAGETYVVFGSSSGFSAALELGSLNGSNGFVLQGSDNGDYSGYSVSSAGDINGDGLDDLLIGADGADPNGNYESGETYVVFGSSSGFSAALELSSLDGHNGFVLQGIDRYDYSGRSVSSAGDINGDGLDDLLIGAPDAYVNGNLRAGETYVVFGRDHGLSVAENSAAGSVVGSAPLATDPDANDSLSYSITAGNTGNAFAIDPGTGQITVNDATALDFETTPRFDLSITATDSGGLSTTTTQVVRLDNVAEAPQFEPLYPVNFALSSLNGSNGFVLQGIAANDQSGVSVSSAGDFNGDGIDDLLIGAFGADPNGNYDAGETYVVFGSSSGFSAALELSSLNGSNGFVLEGIDGSDFSGVSVSSAGDINGDGLDDLLIGASDADLNGANFVGETYVVLGSSSGLSAALNLNGLNGSNGFVLQGIDANDRSGRSVSSAGDFNGDGLDDLLIGAYGADPNGNAYAGETYVVLGSSTGFSAALELGSLNGSNGFVLQGIDANDRSGRSVSSAGDFNGDGLDDLLIGAFRAYANGNDAAGETYVVFGSSSGIPAAAQLGSFNGSNGFVLLGSDSDYSGSSVSSAGDINGDGLDDLLIGAFGADPNGNPFAGETYVVFGASSGFSAALELSSLDGHNGFVLQGIDAVDFSGISVASAGDINGDGLDDLLVGAFGADANGNDAAGETYVVFGSSSGFSAALELGSLNGSNGFVLEGIDGGDYSGSSVSSAGDINGDGLDDLLIGAPFADPNGNSRGGETYVVFGRTHALSIAENSAAGSVVGGAPLATDSDANDSLSYSITAGNTGNAFAIDPGTGQITVNDATALDFETTPRFDLSVTATDSSGLSTTTTQIVRLEDVDETLPTGGGNVGQVSNKASFGFLAEQKDEMTPVLSGPGIELSGLGDQQVPHSAGAGESVNDAITALLLTDVLDLSASTSEWFHAGTGPQAMRLKTGFVLDTDTAEEPNSLTGQTWGPHAAPDQSGVLVALDLQAGHV